MTTELLLPRLRPDQYQIAMHPAKTKVLAMGRRWGKTVLGGALSLGTASQGGKVAWIVPVYKNGSSLWRWVENTVAPIRRAGGAVLNRSERTVQFTNGGLFGIYSAEREDGIRGESFHLVVLDEAARIAESAWTDAIQPTLADFNGDAILISTQKGINWFYTEWIRGRDRMNAEIAAWTAPSAHNPNRHIQRAAQLAKARVPDRTYRQEWLAQFVTDGSYFQNVDACAVLDTCDAPEQHTGHHIIGGLDWAMTNDYTVLTLGCRECNRAVYWDRFNQIDYTYQRARVVDTCQRWHIAGLLPERNSIGEPNIELLMAAGVPVLDGPDDKPGFNTTATSKPALIQRLASALEHDGYQVPRDYADELRSYEVETMAGGHPRFSAPDGRHDDRVISLALCWWAMTSARELVAFVL